MPNKSNFLIEIIPIIFYNKNTYQFDYLINKNSIDDLILLDSPKISNINGEFSKIIFLFNMIKIHKKYVKLKKSRSVTITSGCRLYLKLSSKLIKLFIN